MRRVWFWAIALISLLFVVGESFLRKAIAVSLCGILSFNSTLCYTNLAKDSGESAIAALPPTEQTGSNSGSQTSLLSQANKECNYSRMFYVVYINGIQTSGDIYWRTADIISELLSKAAVPINNRFVREMTYNYGGSFAGDFLESIPQSLAKITLTGDGQKLIQQIKDLLVSSEKNYQKINQTTSCNCKIPRPKYLLIAESQGNFFAEQVASQLPKEVGERTAILSISSFTDYSQVRGQKLVKAFDYLLRPDEIAAIVNGRFTIRNPGTPNLPAFPTLVSQALQGNDGWILLAQLIIGRIGGVPGVVLNELADALKKARVPWQQAYDSHLVSNYLGKLETPHMKFPQQDRAAYQQVVDSSRDKAISKIRQLFASIEDTYYEKDNKDCPQPQKTGNSYGDPHMITFDGFKYSFQTVGEFTLVKSTDGNFEVQARQGAISNSVSMNTAVAMKIGNSRVALYAKNPPDSDTSTPLRVDGKPTKLENGTLELPGGGKIQGNSSYYLVTASTGEQVGVSLGNERMDIKPYISGQAGQYLGLLGNANGNPGDDLRTRGGKVIPTKENSTYGQLTQALSNRLPVPAPLNQAEKIFFDVLYKEFADSWRISQAESLFDYPPGKDTGTFTNRSFPNSYLSLNSLLPPQIRKAEEICRKAGVESELMDGCIFDVGHTGDASFAESAANALLDTAKDRLLQELTNKIPVPSLPVPVRIPRVRF